MGFIGTLGCIVVPLVAFALAAAVVYAAYLVARGRREQRFWEERFDEVRREARRR